MVLVDTVAGKGRRTLAINTEKLIEIAKRPWSQPRSFTVEGALPPDVTIVGQPMVVTGRTPGRSVIFVELESDDWGEVLGGPMFRVHYHNSEERP